MYKIINLSIYKAKRHTSPISFTFIYIVRLNVRNNFTSTYIHTYIYTPSVAKATELLNKVDFVRIPRKSKRERKKPIKYPGNIYSNNIYANYCSVDIPLTFEEAIESNDCKNWKMAMDKEMERLNKTKTWKLVDKMQEKKILDVMWIYARKSDGRYKAMLVVRDF